MFGVPGNKLKSKGALHLLKYASAQSSNKYVRKANSDRREYDPVRDSDRREYDFYITAFQSLFRVSQFTIIDGLQEQSRRFIYLEVYDMSRE